MLGKPHMCLAQNRIMRSCPPQAAGFNKTSIYRVLVMVAVVMVVLVLVMALDRIVLKLNALVDAGKVAMIAHLAYI
jgi:hypothetical protein